MPVPHTPAPDTPRPALRLPPGRDSFRARALLVGTVRWLVGDEVVASGEAPLARGRGLHVVAWLPALVLVGARFGVRAWRRRA